MSRAIALRVVGASLLAAVLSAVLLAGISTVVAKVSWEERERRALASTAEALARSIEGEASEEGWSLERAAPEILRESALVGHHLEVWNGATLVAATADGQRLGPFTGSRDERPDWLLAERRLRSGPILVVAVRREAGARALSLLARSLLVSLPLAFALAGGVGSLAARQAVRPLGDFAGRLDRLDTSLAYERATGAPREIAGIEKAFEALLARIRIALSREKEFVVNASHELRTPLTRMRLEAERAAEHASADGREALAALVQEIDRLAELVEALLVLAQDESAGVPGAQPVNLADILREAASARGPIALEVPDEALVAGDERLLAVLVTNLLDNALKFAREGGVPTAALVARGSGFALTVTTPGARIPAEDRARIFERFFRSAEARALQRGYGIGLALARHIARLHGGDVRLDEPASNGARFVLTMPGWGGE